MSATMEQASAAEQETPVRLAEREFIGLVADLAENLSRFTTLMESLVSSVDDLRSRFPTAEELEQRMAVRS